MDNKYKISIILLFLGCVAATYVFYSDTKVLMSPSVETVYFDNKNDKIDDDPAVVQDNKSLAGDTAVGDDSIPQARTIADVPFTSQAPFGDWNDPRQQHGCEEASLLMAAYWIRGKDLTAETALREINAVSDFEKEKYGGAYDLSMADTLKLWKEYFGYENAFTKYDITVEDIKEEIAEDNVVVVPMNGVKLKNPHYTAPGPLYHELIIIGYDDKKHEFITNDPGTKFGKSYHYDYDTFMSAIRDYKTGFNEPIDTEIKAMLVIGRDDM